MTLFERVKELSEKRGKNLKQVATELGYGENYFYTIKKKTPGVDRVSELADYFNVSTDYLLGRTDDPNFVSKKPSKFETLAAHAADRNHQVTDEELTKIEAYLDGLIDAHENNK